MPFPGHPMIYNHPGRVSSAMPPGCRPGIPMPKSDIKGEIKKVKRKKFIVKCARRYATTEIAFSSGN